MQDHAVFVVGRHLVEGLGGGSAQAGVARVEVRDQRLDAAGGAQFGRISWPAAALGDGLGHAQFQIQMPLQAATEKKNYKEKPDRNVRVEPKFGGTADALI